MPKLWSQTIDAHRRDVRDAITGTTAALVAEHGLRAVTMSQIADEVGIGRATLYKYFPDVESILMAWHERHVTGHLEQLARLSEREADAGGRLWAVIGAYATMSRDMARQHHGSDLAALVHQGQHVAMAQERLSEFLRDLLADAARAGEVRDDVPPAELASYCLHALAGARSLPSQAAVGRLVQVTRAGLRPGA